ncbi:MAG: DNA polymerase III subunit beta [Solirubrobacterales bacterium]|nr:DNA polymerase III subunit beta [Solirubrobacterales bacterium]
MKFSTTRDDLFKLLQAASRIAGSPTAGQSFPGIQIEALASNTVDIRARDRELGIQLPLSATVDSPGSCLLPARLLVDIVRTLPATAVTLNLEAGSQTVHLTAGSAAFQIRTLRNEDFPVLPSGQAANSIQLPADAFISTVEIVARAASHDETRPVLTGILVSASANELRMVATDSYRLSVKETTVDAPIEGSFEANIPARALQELARLAQLDGANTLSVAVNENQIVFTAGGAVLSSILIDGQFPNYRQLLPDAFEHELRMPVDELIEVVRRIGVVAQKNAPLRLAFAAAELTVSAQTPDVGEAKETIPCPYSGEPMEVGFNVDYLREGLESVGLGGDVIIKLISPLRPGLLESADGAGFTYLIMPVRLNV